MDADPNMWPVPVPFKTLTLSHCGSVFTIVDDHLYDEIRQWNWSASYRDDGKHYAKRKRRKYPLDVGEPTTIYLHRWLAKQYLPRKSNKHYVVDHINGNALDNRLINLRWATPRDNRLNVYGLWFYSNAFQEELEKGNHELWYLPPTRESDDE